MTVLETLTAASGYLGKHGVESPRLNAEHLLAHVLGKKRLDLYLEFDRPLSDVERAPLRELIRNRATGKPLQHLLGTAEFFGRSFLCDARALIPRPETEQLVELVQTKFQSPKPQILDVGTGSGVIALTLALEHPQATVTAIDISPAALALATENAARHDLTDRVTLLQGDLLPEETDPFDFIVANLPYIPSDDMASLQKEVQFDPANALDGGPDGLDLVRKLIVSAPAHLTPSGQIALEIGHDQASRVAELFEQNGYTEVSVHADLQKVDRFVTARRAAPAAA